MKGYISLWATAIITVLIVGVLLFCFYMRTVTVAERVEVQIMTADQAYKMMRDNPTAAGRK